MTVSQTVTVVCYMKTVSVYWPDGFLYLQSFVKLLPPYSGNVVRDHLLVESLRHRKHWRVPVLLQCTGRLQFRR